MDEEIYIEGLGISVDVVRTIVVMAAEKVGGVDRVASTYTTSGIFSVLTGKGTEPVAGVDVHVQDDELYLTVRLIVDFGYRFVDLANDVRTAVADAIRSQLGVRVGAIDVYIESVVIPRS